ncbi:STAS domain-containing protein [Mariniblastus fucicola]|uniref:Anti-sigma-B factor antagonist n=1 Tax=Mariniblastus fucicola TaxID=980251 RepID=A0A5B9P2N5_9BACT|nr:STAS domain-containing protein [Mariniblastus fucicola]QEG20787.1 Anti-sigma-B factor antagonist [Mariniblastus fucicola]
MATLLTRKDGDILVVYFQDVSIIDEARIAGLGEELLELVKNENEKIVVNFENVSFMSSAMIGKLIHFSTRCKEEELKLRLCNINENVMKVFTLMNLQKVFDIDTDESDAVAKLKKSGWFS